MNNNLTHKILYSKDWQLFKEFRLFSLQESPDIFGLTYEEVVTSSDSFWEQNISNGCFLAFFDSNKIVATLNISFANKIKFKHVAKISNVYILPDYRRQGLLFNLLKQAETLATKNNVGNSNSGRHGDQ
jgi:GNAT superfamily N-acetyltransferase